MSNNLFDFVIKKTHVVSSVGVIDGDVAVRDGKIVAVGKVAGLAKKENNGAELFLLPGAIDMHVHFRDPGSPEKEDFASGSAAAAAGGITTVIDMPNTVPLTTTVAALEAKRKIAAEKSQVNCDFFFGATDNNLDEILQAQKKGIAGVKVYLAPSTGGLVLKNMNLLEELFKRGIFVIVHAEDAGLLEKHEARYKGAADPQLHSSIRSGKVAFEAVKKVLHLAKKFNARVHITHVSTAAEVMELRKFKSPFVTADATPHHLFLNETACAKQGNFVKVNPPLRSEEDRIALWAGIKEGIIQAVASDHAPHTREEKEKPYPQAPAGVPGVETLLPLLLDAVNHGELTLSDVVRLTSENPARILGFSQKGKIEVGADADLVLVDMSEERVVGMPKIFSKCGWSPFEGKKLKGWPVMTFVQGKIVFEGVP